MTSRKKLHKSKPCFEKIPNFDVDMIKIQTREVTNTSWDYYCFRCLLFPGRVISISIYLLSILVQYTKPVKVLCREEEPMDYYGALERRFYFRVTMN